MQKGIRQYLKCLAPLSVAALVSACGGGSTANNSSTANTGNLNSLSIVAPSSYPAGVVANVPVVITNDGNETINNLSYAIDSNSTGGVISINAASATGCQVLAPQASCTLSAEVAATPATHPGDFSVAISQGSLQSSLSHKTTSTSISVGTNIGLVELPTNNASGADGLTIYYPNVIVGNSNNGANQIIVTAVVTSANAGSFNTISLVDSSGDILNYTVLSGNSGNGMTPLAVGSIVTLLVTIPNGSNQLQFTAQTKQNDQVISTSTNSNTVAVSDPVIPTGILTVSPNYFSLTPSYESQIITLNNSGNGAISSLSFTPLSPLTELSSTCDGILESGASCQYIVKFNKDIPEAGTTSLTINYNDGSSAQSATATVNYTGVDPIAGLTISSNSANFDFSSRTNAPQDTEVVVLTNIGNTTESNFTYSLPAVFSTNADGLNNACTANIILAPGESCNINLVYINSSVTAPTTADITVNYKVGSSGSTASSSVGVTYQTLQSQAILVLSPNPVNFANIVNNNFENNSQTVTLTNTGDETATGIVANIVNGSGASPFTQTGGCSSLIAGGSCNYTIKFGPTSSAVGNKSDFLNVAYTPYSSAAQLTTTDALSGFVASAQGANISALQTAPSGFAGGDGTSGMPYVVQQSSTAPTISYTLTNSGTVPATSFYLSNTLSSPWSIASNSCGGSLGSSVTLSANGGSCVVIFSLNTSTVGSSDLNLSAITMNWVDQDSPNGQSQALSGMVYSNVYAPATIALSTDPANSISIAPGESFSMTATLSGGYNVAAQTINATNATAGISLVNNNCALNSQNSYSCTISVVAANNAAAASSQIVTLSNSTTSAMVPTPSTVTFEIMLPVPIVATIALPQTGQTPTLPITATAGMDGYTYIGVPWAYVASGTTTPITRFSVGSDSEVNCVTDNLTGLMWVKDRSTVRINGENAGNATTLQKALDSIATANSGVGYCGHKDWYLPTINDLASLLNDGQSSPVAWLNTQGFSNVMAATYWSSTASASDNTYTWNMNLYGNGSINTFTNTRNSFVWPVRLVP